MFRHIAMHQENNSFTFSFHHIGEYPLYVHQLDRKGELTHEKTPFPCSIRNREELLTERVELKRGEELHAQRQGFTRPLIRIDHHGVWAWMTKQDLWWPIPRKQPLALGINRFGDVQLVWPSS
jgi:hypothetical protein